MLRLRNANWTYNQTAESAVTMTKLEMTGMSGGYPPTGTRIRRAWAGATIRWLALASLPFVIDFGTQSVCMVFGWPPFGTPMKNLMRTLEGLGIETEDIDIDGKWIDTSSESRQAYEVFIRELETTDRYERFLLIPLAVGLAFFLQARLRGDDPLASLGPLSVTIPFTVWIGWTWDWIVAFESVLIGTFCAYAMLRLVSWTSRHVRDPDQSGA